MIKLKIDVKKIAKEHLFTGAKGTYLDLALMENRDGTDQYGNDGFIIQEVTKQAREAGVRGPIIGNWRTVGTKPQSDPTKWADRTKPAPRTTDEATSEPEEDDIPF